MNRIFLYFEAYVPDFLKEFVKFLGVGVVNTLIGLSLIVFFHSILGLHYMLSNFLGYFCGVVFGYVMHLNITFRSRVRPSALHTNKFVAYLKTFRKFSMVFTVCYLIQLGCLFIMVDIYHFWVTPSQVIAIGIYVLASYFGNSIFTFKKVRE
jgi:putative flippase GtrA